MHALRLHDRVSGSQLRLLQSILNAVPKIALYAFCSVSDNDDDLIDPCLAQVRYDMPDHRFVGNRMHDLVQRRLHSSSLASGKYDC